jgi:hypothetical protein
MILRIKTISVSALLFVSLTGLALAERPVFEGLEKAMDPQTFRSAGIDTLSAEERAVLDAFLRDYVAGKQRDAAAVAGSQAVDRAVKERKVRPPELIQSKMVGAYKGYGPRTFFHLANGEVWRPTNDDVLNLSPIQDPTVIIYRDTFGYKMFIEGASVVRVRRVQ